jgi:hypothetical protein
MWTRFPEVAAGEVEACYLFSRPSQEPSPDAFPDLASRLLIDRANQVERLVRS